MYYLAQVNIAKLKKPIDHPDSKGFVDQLDTMNELAEKSQGFIWRLKDNVTNDATSINAFDNPKIIVNISVWNSVEDLKNYTYFSAHKEPMQNRKQWFTRLEGPHLALWWIHEDDEMPTVEDAKRRLFSMDLKGPTAYAFDFKSNFEAPDSFL